MLQALAIGATLLSMMSDDDGGGGSDEDRFTEIFQRAVAFDNYDLIVQEWIRTHDDLIGVDTVNLHPGLYVPLVRWVNEAENLEELGTRYEILTKVHRAFDKLKIQSGVNFGLVGRASVRFEERMLSLRREFTTITLQGVPLLKTFGGSLPYPMTFEPDPAAPEYERVARAKKGLGISEIDVVQVDLEFNLMLSWDTKRFLVTEIDEDLCTEKIVVVPRSKYPILRKV